MTTEMESCPKPKPSHIAQVESHSEAVIAHQTRCYDGNAGNIMVRLKKLETRVSEGQPVPGSIGNPKPSGKRPVVCHNYLQEGHYARGCALPPARISRDQSRTSYQSATRIVSMVESVESMQALWLTKEHPSPCWTKHSGTR